MGQREKKMTIEKGAKDLGRNFRGGNPNGQ